MPLVDSKQVFKSTKDGLDRIDCKNQQVFQTEYLTKRKPVMLGTHLQRDISCPVLNIQRGLLIRKRILVYLICLQNSFTRVIDHIDSFNQPRLLFELTTFTRLIYLVYISFYLALFTRT